MKIRSFFCHENRYCISADTRADKPAGVSAGSKAAKLMAKGACNAPVSVKEGAIAVSGRPQKTGPGPVKVSLLRVQYVAQHYRCDAVGNASG
jgi:hypothetical protein